MRHMEVGIDQARLLRYLKFFYWIYWMPKIGKWWYALYMQRLRYSFEDDYFLQESGVFFYQRKRIPYAGLREVAVCQGPLLQWLGLSVVVGRTAAQGNTFYDLRVLCPADPEAVVAELTRRAVAARQA